MSTVPFPSRLCGGLLVVMVALLLPVHSAAGKSSYTGVLSFGDSLADTGNALAHTGGGVGSQLPYGETFFGHPTGRASDGRIVLDFIGAHPDRHRSMADLINIRLTYCMMSH